jgi:hypothetical protein
MPTDLSLRDPATQTASDTSYRTDMARHFETARGETADKLDAFPRFVSRQCLALFLAKEALFERVLPVHGAIVECGVFMGSGLFTWVHLSAIHEPVNHNRRIIGFDTFDGFPALSPEDSGVELGHRTEGGYRFDGEEELRDCARLHDMNRPIGHIPKIDLVKGDATATIPKYVENNPHLVVAMLYLDFDLYAPTRAALECLLPRMPRGAVVAFDELNQAQWPGETQAVLDVVGLRNLRIERMPYTPSLSFAVLD